MNLEKFLEKINPDSCSGCSHKKKEVAIVPPPDEIVGIIVSRDPTVDWLPFYKCVVKNEDKDTPRKMLFASAIPVSLLTKIFRFKGEGITRDIGETLFNVTIRKTYWTHMHKCFTDKSRKETEFKERNATICAYKWLKEELNCAISDKTRFIIALGNEVQSWFRDWNHRENKGTKIINLPHPSGQNNLIWYRSQKNKYKEKIKETDIEINNLIKVCKGIR